MQPRLPTRRIIRAGGACATQSLGLLAHVQCIEHDEIDSARRPVCVLCEGGDIRRVEKSSVCITARMAA